MSSSFHASTVDWLGCWIATGQVKPGETIKVEADLGEQLGVSRTVIREAIKTLVAKGLLEVGPKVGTRVLPVRRWNLFDPQVVGWLSRSGLPENFVDDLLDLRRTIEPMAVRWACERATVEQVQAIQQAYNRQQSEYLDQVQAGSMRPQTGSRLGGNPDDKCRSDALFLTLKASSSVISIRVHPQR